MLVVNISSFISLYCYIRFFKILFIISTITIPYNDSCKDSPSILLDIFLVRFILIVLF